MLFITNGRALRTAVSVLFSLFALSLSACKGSGGGGGGGGGGGSAPTYSIGGSVSGLTGSGLVLQNNSGDDLAVGADGSFTFTTAQANATTYNVTVRTQPSSPSQTCTVTSPSGTVNGANVTSVQVSCTTNSYLVTGTVVGLAGSGLVLQLNSGNNLVIGNSNFTFPVSVTSGATYDVTVLTQPSSPAQTCAVSNGSGTMGGSNVSNVIVSCVTNVSNTPRTINVNVSGWSGTGTAPVLQLNGGNNLTIANGANAFSATLTDGATYNVTVLTQPTGPTQTCTVANGSGAVSGSDVTVTATCATNTYAVGGAVSGLSGSGLGLQLQLSGSNNLSVTANGSYTFTAPVADGSPYTVSVHTQPSSPSQTCTVANPSGTVNGANVTDADVSCVTNRYVVSVTVNGLSGSGLVLRNNGADDVPVSANGSYSFVTTVASGSTYNVTVATPPFSPSQTCSVANGSGTVGNGNVTNVVVSCAINTYAISGTISGLTGGGLVLQLNGTDSVSPAAGNTGFAFNNAIADGSSYNVTVATQPLLQTCVVSSASGTVNGGNVTDVAVSCTTQTWSGTSQFGTSSDDVANAVTIDSNGNVIAAGCLGGALRNNHSNYKNTCDTAGGSANSFVRKYSTTGTAQWTQQLSNGINVEANGVVTDSSRNVYVTGFTYGALDGQAAVGGKDVFLTKYDESGNKLWTYQFGSVADDQGNAIAIDGSGNLYIVGTTFGNFGGTGSGNHDVFVARLDAASVASGTTPPAGTTWLVQFGTSAADFGHSIAVDAGGNPFVSGLTLGTLGSSAQGLEDVFVAKLDPSNGTRSWTQQLGTSSYDYDGGVAVDASGNVYVGGYTTGFVTPGAYDPFVVSYDTSGAQRWLQQLTSANHDYTMGLAVSGSSVYVTGYTVGNFDGNNNADASGNTTDVFLVQYDVSGNKQWSRTFGTTTDEKSYGVVTDASGNALVTGYTLGGLDGNNNAGGADLFVVGYTASGVKQ